MIEQELLEALWVGSQASGCARLHCSSRLNASLAQSPYEGFLCAGVHQGPSRVTHVQVLNLAFWSVMRSMSVMGSARSVPHGEQEITTLPDHSISTATSIHEHVVFPASTSISTAECTSPAKAESSLQISQTSHPHNHLSHVKRCHTRNHAYRSRQSHPLLERIQTRSQGC